jgi:hypothetical protein
MPGEYSPTKTFELDARDNGLTIEAMERGKAVIPISARVARIRLCAPQGGSLHLR